MSNYRRLQHTEWDCKYHIVFIPKYRRKVLYGTLRKYLGEVFHRLAQQKQSQIEEGHLMPDHVHMMMTTPPKYAVSQVVGDIKGKSAIHVARHFGERRRNFVGGELLGAGVLGLDRGSRRGSHPSVHPEPGDRGHEAGEASARGVM